ncbi:MAG: hypothetical protein ABIP44_11700 [Pseudoxanthomonas sp.]
MNIIEFLQGVPAPAWGLAGAIVGAFAGVFGTLRATRITTRNGDARLERQLKHDDARFKGQLEHDAEQKSKDRAAVLRREVYLKAAEEMAAINGLLGQLASVDPTDAKAMSEGMLGFFKATAKVSLVASESTRKKVAELSGAYGKLFIDLMSDASEAHRLKIDINVNRGAYETINIERMRIVAAMRDANENADSKYKFEALSNSFDSTAVQVDGISAEFSELSDKHNDALAAYGVSTGRKIAGLIELQAEVAALLRGEFDLDVDVEAMKAQFKEQSEKALATGDEFFTKLKAMRDEDAANEAKAD